MAKMGRREIFYIGGIHYCGEGKNCLPTMRLFSGVFHFHKMVARINNEFQNSILITKHF